MTINKILKLTLLITSLSSCEYSPTAINYKELTPSDPPEATIQTSELYNGVKVFGNVAFTGKLSIDLKKTSLKNVSFIITNTESGKIGDEDIVYPNVSYSNNTETFSVTVNTSVLSNGTHYLKVFIRTSVGSGSLGDNLGIEQYQISNTWSFVVQNYSAVPINIQTIQVVDGKLVVNWTKYPYPNFKQYRLKMGWSQYDPSGGLNLYFETVAEITKIDSISTIIVNPNILPFGFVTFYLETETFTGSNNIVTGSSKKIDLKTPSLIIDSLSYNKFIIKWRKPKLTSIFNKYSIGINSYSSSWNSSEINDTSYTYNDFVFGSNTQIYLSVNNYFIEQKTLNQQITAFADTSIIDVHYNNEKILLQLVDNRNSGNVVLRLLNYSDLKVLNQVSAPHQNNFQFKYWNNDTICYVDGSKIIFISESNLSVVKTIDLQSMYGYPMMIAGSSVSNTGYIFILPGKIIGPNSLETSTVDEINYLTKTKIKSGSSLTESLGFISPLGKYVVKNNKFYTANNYFAGGTFLYQIPVERSINYFYDSDNKYYSTTIVPGTNSEISSVFNSSSGTLIQKIDSKVAAFDYFKSNYLALVNGFLELRNLNTGLISKVKSVPINSAILLGKYVFVEASNNYYLWRFN